MQQRHSYPSKRNQWPTSWYVRAGATVDDEPLPPNTADRTREIRRIFLEGFRGHATIDQVGAAAEEAGLLASLRTPRSMRECVMEALRPVASHNPYDGWFQARRVSAPSPPG